MAKDYREKVVETIGEQKEREVRDQVVREKAEKQVNQITASYKDLKRETPMSYTEAKKAFDRIRDICDVKEYSAHDFRDTCATEWRESGISIDMIARLLGHQKTEVTEQRYVKYRPELYRQAKEKMNVYGTRNGTKADG